MEITLENSIDKKKREREREKTKQEREKKQNKRERNIIRLIYKHIFMR